MDVLNQAQIQALDLNVFTPDRLNQWAQNHDTHIINRISEEQLRGLIPKVKSQLSQTFLGMLNEEQRFVLDGGATRPASAKTSNPDEYKHQ